MLTGTRFMLDCMLSWVEWKFRAAGVNVKFPPELFKIRKPLTDNSSMTVWLGARC